MDRRGFLARGAALTAAASAPGLAPAWAARVSHGLAAKGSGVLSGTDIRLAIADVGFDVDGRSGHAIAVNGTIPAPLIRLREGDRVRLTVENHLKEDTSIHWHGLLVPFRMDGVPGISFPGIRAGASFTYEFPIIQSGTYWYHSHSGLQEQLGHYGPIIIDPAGTDPIASEREHVVVLSDWSFMHAHSIAAMLKKEGGVFNRHKSTLTKPVQLPPGEKAMFDRMRMDPTDISDVTGSVYTFLINGHSPAENWTGLFTPGERVRLRIINAAAQTIFNLRIPGLKMTVVAADGIRVRPVEVDEFQIGNAETYDVIVTPADAAYTLVAESIDRSGMGVATLAPRAGMRAPVPALRPPPVLTMKDMGHGSMDHSAVGHAGAGQAAGEHAGMEHGAAAPSAPSPPAMGHGAMNHGGGTAKTGAGSMDMRDKSKVDFPVGPGVDMIAPMPVDRIGDPGLGLDTVEHRVLNYKDLAAIAPGQDNRVPTRRIDIHLTGNMERFMWSLDGEKLSERPEPYRLARNERVRLRLINDTMMTHPMHLHGHFFELVNGHGSHQPLKHTVRVLPGGYVDLDLTADAPGDWAFHCHMLYHMHAGMMRVVTVRPLEGDAA